MEKFSNHKEICMKKLFFLVLLLFVLGSAYGQTRAENRWILGGWVNTTTVQREVLQSGAWSRLQFANQELVLNDNGTGRFLSEDIIFSIIGNELQIFRGSGNSLWFSLTIHRINDQRMVLRGNIDGSMTSLNFNRRN